MEHLLKVGLYFSPTPASLTSFPHIVRFINFSGETASYSWIPYRIPSGFHQANVTFPRRSWKAQMPFLSQAGTKIILQKKKHWRDFTPGSAAISFFALPPQKPLSFLLKVIITYLAVWASLWFVVWILGLKRQGCVLISLLLEMLARTP